MMKVQGALEAQPEGVMRPQVRCATGNEGRSECVPFAAGVMSHVCVPCSPHGQDLGDSHVCPAVSSAPLGTWGPNWEGMDRGRTPPALTLRVLCCRGASISWDLQCLHKSPPLELVGEPPGTLACVKPWALAP